jgi:hypothetical protein
MGSAFLLAGLRRSTRWLRWPWRLWPWRRRRTFALGHARPCERWTHHFFSPFGDFFGGRGSPCVPRDVYLPVRESRPILPDPDPFLPATVHPSRLPTPRPDLSYFFRFSWMRSTSCVFGFAWACFTVVNRPVPELRPTLPPDDLPAICHPPSIHGLDNKPNGQAILAHLSSRRGDRFWLRMIVFVGGDD